MMRYFLNLIINPKSAVEKILKAGITFKRIALFLLAIGAGRGLLEVVWFYMDRGALSQAVLFLKSPTWHLFEFWPAIFSCVFTAYIRWITYAMFIVFAAKIFGKKADFSAILKIYGILLGIFILPAILNFTYLIRPLPMIRFNISGVYNHIIGLGQILSAILFVYLSTNILNSLLKIKPTDAFLISLSIPVIDRAVYVGLCVLFFNARPIAGLSLRYARFFEALIFISISAIFIALFILYNKRQSRHCEDPNKIYRY